jgi:hypothetical protein
MYRKIRKKDDYYDNYKNNVYQTVMKIYIQNKFIK